MYREALADLEQAVALFDEPYEEVLAHLANAALKAGEADKAFDAFRSIRVMGEYDYAQHTLDSLMTVRGYSTAEKEHFEQSIWQTRETRATVAQGFDLPTLEGTSYSYDPSGGRVAVLNFMSPT
jgi:hypothetical protein